ncbi:SHOCT domain-containing protein [Thermogemmatispora tikiterensis]|nr:SHOCT domain-containing protein [Thermogemmatispora tikiterensis]
MMWGFGCGGMLWMWLGAVLWLILLAALAWTLFRLARGKGWFSGGPSRLYPSGPNRSPLQILQERYARGEIDAATFDEMLARLRSSEESRQ